ncbi:MAG: hypothetical protein AAFP08_02340, partial [Bacteroidota bacterium]
MLQAKLKEVPANYHDRLNQANLASVVANILLLIAVTVFADSGQAYFYVLVIAAQAAATVLLFKSFKGRMSRVLLVDSEKIVLEDPKSKTSQTFSLSELDQLKWSDHLEPVSARQNPWWKFSLLNIEVPWISLEYKGESRKYYYDPDSEYMRNRLKEVLAAWEA